MADQHALYLHFYKNHKSKELVPGIALEFYINETFSISPGIDYKISDIKLYLSCQDPSLGKKDFSVLREGMREASKMKDSPPPPLLQALP